MNSLAIDVERFAYDIFRINWIKSKVPRHDIPFNQHTENRYSLDFINSIAKYVMFYQVLIRNDIKKVTENKDLGNVDDEFNMFEFFNQFMRLDKDLFIYQVMQNVACSLAICLELTLYKYPTRRRLLGHISGSWKTYFQRFLQLDFFLNGGFEGLLQHAESMHTSNYTLDKYIYESNRVYIDDGSNIWTTSHVPTFLKENKIKVDGKIRYSTVSLLNHRSISGNSRFLRILCESEIIPVVGKWIRWTKKRLDSIGSILLRRRSKRGGSIGSFLFRRRSKYEEKLLDSSSESGSSENSTAGFESGAKANRSVVSSMIENYMKSVHEYHREEIDEFYWDYAELSNVENASFQKQ